MKARIKICRIRRRDETTLAVHADASALAIDICNGVRSAGKLDADKLQAFMPAAQGGP